MQFSQEDWTIDQRKKQIKVLIKKISAQLGM